jgi:hypothetical protein
VKLYEAEAKAESCVLRRGSQSTSLSVMRAVVICFSTILEGEGVSGLVEYVFF